VRKPLLEPQVGRSGQLPTTVRGEKHNVCLRRLGHSSVDQIQVGRVVLEITQISGDNGLRVPAELTILSKTLLNLDLVGQTLGPKFNPNASIRRNAEKILQQRVWKSFSQANLLGGLLEIRSKGNPQ
jgi:predicted unusual protein kinase regulating ubiquinone biosynthesis (AarF/ABC1/UbiB family)